ncbi:M14 family zinc carboxypeptidase [Parabacteroides sp. PF5-6]|uniref:M14 family zinc carboxypeptidase n=1 Tax=Parabacteroides sp. PF5-6 TaxID=1742403 RepID=UPI002405E50E|nr:M14 family zinc carboxypeptidase [Parabacteroides sp. PF5-6]MDF9831396.1 hypothetical protein [Parabacteroides sp. PF5-6]
MKSKVIFAFAALLLALSHLSAQQLPAGEGMFTFTAYIPFADRPVDVHYYIPPLGDRKNMPVVFVFEGADRGYAHLVRTWQKLAEERNFIFLLPHFDLELYPLEDYQETGVLTTDRTGVKEQALQTSALIDEIFHYFREHSGAGAAKYNMYGHSAGGQFVHRYMLFYDSPYVAKAIVGSPGWYTFPDKEQLFPYGVGDIPYVDDDVLKRYLAKDIVIQLGMKDTIRESFLRKTPEAELQGRERLERGRTFYNFAQQLAAENGWPFHWRKEEVEGVGHQSSPMGIKAIPTLLNDSIRALFIGNSYTFFNEMPRMVQAIAHSTGRPLAVKQVAHGGWYLRQHAESRETLDAIKEGGWDFVVFQEQSQAPAKEKGWVQENVYPYAQALDSVRKAFNPKGKTIFFMTWGHHIDTYNEMQQRLAESYLEMAGRLDAWCAPVGISWKRVRKERPALSLYEADGSHPTLSGSYLAANVFYSTFFQTPYQSVYTAGLDEEEAAYLQRIAQEVVLSNLPQWNLRPIPQSEEISRKFYPEPQLQSYHTPTLRKHFTEGLASTVEIAEYLQALAGKYPDASFSSIGRTEQGREIPIFYLGKGNDKRKVKVWIQAGLHGNEPAGPEAVCMLADYLLNSEEGRLLLNHLEIALLPIANVDGYAIQSRVSGSGLDLNRDQTKLADPVSVLLKEAFMAWNPEVALDIHEYRPWKPEYHRITGREAGVYEDILFLPTGHLNVAPGIRNFSLHVLQERAGQALAAKGYSYGYYYTVNQRGEQLSLSKGARSPQSSSTNYALSNALSMFLEIRGIGLGQTSFARRVDIGYTVACNLLQTCVEEKKSLKKVITQAIKETRQGKSNVHVSFRSKETTESVRFVDATLADTFSIALPFADATACEPLFVRQRPKAYLLLDTCFNAVRILQTLGVHVERIDKEKVWDVEEYVVTEHVKNPVEWEKIHVVRCTAETRSNKRLIPAGSYLVPLNQKNANYAVTLLEPESTNGFVSFGVIAVGADKAIPVCRILN